MADTEIAFLSIAELGARYRSGALSPTAVTEICLERIERLDGALNAVVASLTDQARAAAAKAEQELGAGHDRGPLHGVPVGIKDLIDIAGTVTGFGSVPVFAAAATRDAALVRTLREAGAVLIAKTNLLEFAYGAVNPKVGQTNNPWDTGRTSGGSSGGSAAGVAAGLCYAAAGTDTGGSIRIPAAYCGVVGLKPTYDLVPLAGASLLSWSLDHIGPIGRSCADAAAMLGGLTGRRFDATPRPLRGLRFGLIAALRDAEPVTRGVRAGIEAACGALRDAGATVEEIGIDGLDDCAEALLHVLLPEASVIQGRLLDAHPEALAEQTRGQLELGSRCRPRPMSARSSFGVSSARRSSIVSIASMHCCRPRCHGRRWRRTRTSMPRAATARCCARRRPTSAACRAWRYRAGRARTACR